MPELSGSEPPKISEEAIRAAGEAIEDKAILRLGRDLGTIHRDEIVHAGLVAAYPLLRQQWEAEFLERMKAAHSGDQWWEGYEAGCSMSHSLGCDAVEAQRDALVEQNGRLSMVVAEGIARAIEAVCHCAGDPDPSLLENCEYRRAAAIARERGARLAGPNGSEVPRAT